MVKRDGNQSGRRRRKVSRGGHPSRGGTTVGGGTKTPPTRYVSPTPSPKPYVRPPIKTQPGPISEKERRTKIESPRGKRAVKRGRRVARKHRARRETAEALRAFRRTQRSIGLEKKRDTDTHIGPLNIEAELEGRGGISKAAEFVKKQATSSMGQAALKSAGVPQLGSEKLQKNLTKDLVDLPAQAIPSAYAVGAGAVEAAQGRPRRIKKLYKDVKEHDPVALAVQGKFKQAAKEAEKHPGLTALSVSGAGAVVSRGAGAVVRGGARVAPSKKSRKALRRVGTTKRAPRVAPGTGIREQRTYSKGLIGKGAQVAVESAKVRSARRLRRKAKAASDPKKKAGLREQANRRDPRIATEQQIARRVDEREAMAEVRRRTHRGQAVEAAEKALPRKHADVALLLAQGVSRASRESLSKLKRDLDKQLKSGNLSRSQALATRKLRDQVKGALADKKLDLPKLEAAGRAYAKVVAPRQKELVRRGVLDPQVERMAKLIPVAVKEMGAKWSPVKRKVQDAMPEGTGWKKAGTHSSGKPLWVREGRLELRGEKLPVSRIEAYLRSTGRDPDDIPYVTQAPGQRGAKNFFSSWHDPKGIMSTRRTGEATRKGSFEVSRDVGRENVARQQGLIDAHNEYAEFIGEVGHRRHRKAKVTEFPDRKAAENWMRENLADSPYEWRAVPTRPLFGRKDQSKALLDQADAQDTNLTASVREGIQAALRGEGDGKWVLVPAAAADRLSKHSRLLGSTGTKLTRKVGRQFSGTVLTTSGFTWPIGNVMEASLRGLIAHAGPASLALGRKTVAEIKKIDPARGEELEARIGTGHLGAYELNHVHSTARDFQGTRFAPVARVTGAFFRAPGPKQVAQLWNGWTKAIFTGNGWIEHQFRTALLGRYLRDQGYSPKKLALTEGTHALSKAAEQAARGMRGTNEQVAAARFIRRAYGQYEAWSPEMRFTIAVFTPFVAWSLNAVKFMVSVLPKDHPVLTGLLASSERATEEWRNQHGLGKFIDGAAPNWMQPSIVVDGKLVPVGRYTPFGFWADPLEAGGSLLLPQINGLVLASKGLDWKGDPLNDHERADDVTEAERAEAMGKVAAGSFIPFFGLNERLKEKGTTALNPARSYEHNQKVSAAFDELERIEAKKAEIKAKHPKVDSDNPTPEYERLHRRFRELNERIFEESGGKWGVKYKEPYEPSGGSTGGGGWDQFREGSAPKVKSGWDAYR